MQSPPREIKALNEKSPGLGLDPLCRGSLFSAQAGGVPKSAQPARRRRSRRSGTPRTRTTPKPRPTCSPPATAPSGPRRPPRSPTTSTCCWPSTTTRRALDPPAHHQPDRVHLRHRQASPASHQGPRLPRRRCRDGVQAHRISTDPVAGRQRTPPRRAGPCRRGIQERQAHRTTRRIRGW